MFAPAISRRGSISLNHLVSAGHNTLGNGQAKRRGGLEIYSKFENHRLLDRKLSRVRPFENPVDVLRHLAIDRRKDDCESADSSLS